jgi:hypothetical protein
MSRNIMETRIIPKILFLTASSVNIHHQGGGGFCQINLQIIIRRLAIFLKIWDNTKWSLKIIPEI